MKTLPETVRTDDTNYVVMTKEEYEKMNANAND